MIKKHLVPILLLLPLIVVAEVADRELIALESTKSKMIDHMNALSLLIEESGEADAYAADALSQIAGEWVIHLTYNITLLRSYQAVTATCSGLEMRSLIITRLNRVLEAALSSIESTNMLLGYAESEAFAQLGKSFAADLATMERQLRGLSRVI